MPPKPTKQKQSQAGKFKPLKRPAKKAGAGGGGTAASSSSEAPPPAASAPSASSSSGGGRGKATSPERSRGRGRDTQAGASTRGGRGGRGRSRSPKGRGGSGRGGRAGGRGRGRGGRFIVPAGAAFFTGEAAKRSSSDTAVGGARGAGPTPDAGTDGAVVLPGARAAAASGASGGGGGRASRSAAAVASRAAREGEGEEIVVAEWMDVEGGEEKKKRSSVLDGPSRSARTSGRFDDGDVQEKEASVEWHEAGPSDAFVYDSDSSVEEERRARRHARGGSGGGGFGMPPAQLPFPAAHGRPAMYACQDVPAGGEEKKMSEGEALLASATMTASAKLRDPPVQSPFVDVDAASDEEKRRETEAWFVMKFPTRLPPLDAASTITASGQSSKRTASLVKNELGDDGPDVVGSTHLDSGEGTHPSSSAPSRPRGYDDTLKDAAPGRYGRIVVRRSGRTELVLGGGGEEGPPEVRLLVHEGLRCGFRQEAVCLDPEQASFVMLGDVDRSLVATPDVERAFAFS